LVPKFASKFLIIISFKLSKFSYSYSAHNNAREGVSPDYYNVS